MDKKQEIPKEIDEHLKLFGKDESLKLIDAG